MFSSISVLLLFIFAILQTYAARNNIDRIIRYCEIKEDNFSATEDKYAKRGPHKPTDPQISPGPTFSFLIQNQLFLCQSEVMQRKFECIANITKKSDEKLRSSSKYLSLVDECKTNQSPKAVNYDSQKCNFTCPYKKTTGECNNMLHQNLGCVFSSFRRFLPANYEGISGFRKSVKEKKPLPNARDISRELIKPSNSTTRKYNALFAFFGQFVASDIALFPDTFVYGSERLDCCKNATNGGALHPQCAPILIDPIDEFYSQKNVICFNFVRAVPYDTCSVGKRNLINYVSTWIDLSQIYGSTIDRADKLSTTDESGKLISEDTEGGELLPPETESGSSCGDAKKGEYCFKSGDPMVNSNTPLMIFHTLFVREHNRIADVLKSLNPNWDDEKLYRESRRIVIAEFEVIIFNEYLPVLLGQRIMSKYRLNTGSLGVYDPELDPSISVIFHAAAFRIDTIVPGKVVYGEQANQLRDLYGNAVPIYKDRISSFLYKMATTKAETYDRYMPADLTLFFQNETCSLVYGILWDKRSEGQTIESFKNFLSLYGTWGFDVNALIIQRGRDVGLPSYTQVIEYIEKRNGTIKTFDDLKPYIKPDCLDIYKNIYEDVRDIDFYVGIICEKYPDDMIISETAAEIIAEQFYRLKYADRYYFENDLMLTLDQKQTLMNASLARLICDNTAVKRFQKLAFLFPSNKNRIKKCSSIPSVDLMKWKENVVQEVGSLVDKHDF